MEIKRVSQAVILAAGLTAGGATIAEARGIEPGRPSQATGVTPGRPAETAGIVSGRPSDKPGIVPGNPKAETTKATNAPAAKPSTRPQSYAATSAASGTRPEATATHFMPVNDENNCFVLMGVKALNYGKGTNDKEVQSQFDPGFDRTNGILGEVSLSYAPFPNNGKPLEVIDPRTGKSVHYDTNNVNSAVNRYFLTDSKGQVVTLLRGKPNITIDGHDGLEFEAVAKEGKKPNVELVQGKFDEFCDGRSLAKYNVYFKDGGLSQWEKAKAAYDAAQAAKATPTPGVSKEQFDKAFGDLNSKVDALDKDVKAQTEAAQGTTDEVKKLETDNQAANQYFQRANADQAARDEQARKNAEAAQAKKDQDTKNAQSRLDTWGSIWPWLAGVTGLTVIALVVRRIRRP